MSQHLISRVGDLKVIWKTTPRGSEGVAQVQVRSKDLEVQWKRDRDGLWISFPQGVYGFDLKREWDEDGQVFFHVSQRGTGAEWLRVPFSRGEQSAPVTNRGAQAKVIRVKAQMPRRIVRVMIEPQQRVEKGQPALVMEAMKMENEIRVPQSGRVSQVKVSEGQVVETGAELILIESDV